MTNFALSWLPPGVGYRIGRAGFFETFESELATIAQAAGTSIGARIVATPGERVVEPKIETCPNDLCLCQVKQGGVNFQVASALHAGFGGEIGHSFIRPNIFFAAVGIAAVVELIGAKKDILSFDALGPGEREGKKNRVARGHVGAGYALRDRRFATSLRHFDLIGQRGAADGPEIEANYLMRICRQERRNSFGRLKLALMALAVMIAQRVELEALLFCERRGSGGVDAAAEENNRLSTGHCSRSGNLGSLHGVALLVPADDPFVEHFHIAVTIFVEDAIGQTGQVMGARSIEDDGPVARNAFYIVLKFFQWCGDGAEDMHFTKFFLRAHVDDHRLGAGF